MGSTEQVAGLDFKITLSSYVPAQKDITDLSVLLVTAIKYVEFP